MRRDLAENGRASTNELLAEAAARSWSILRRYHGSERSDGARALMIAEVDTLVGWLLELNLKPGEAQAGLLDPVDAHLLARYGHEVGRRLNAEFVDAFEVAGMRLLAPGPVRPGPVEFDREAG